MITSEQQREENYQDFLRLQENPNYIEVTFDVESGGVSAIHREHLFDKQLGPFGYKRGQYEIDAVDILRCHGHQIILESEYPKGENVRIYDAIYDGLPAEIKAVEGNGRNAIRTKLFNAAKQGAVYVILIFPDRSLFSIDRVLEGWKDFSRNRIETRTTTDVQIICIVEGSVVEIEKPPR